MVATDTKSNIYLSSGEATRIYSSTGELKMELAIPSTGTSPLISGNGTVYIPGNGFPGKIYAFKGYAEIGSTWPRTYGGGRNTGGR